VVSQNFEPAARRRHRLNRQPTSRGAPQIQVLGGTRSRRLEIERFAGRAVKQQNPRYLTLVRMQANRSTIQRDAVARGELRAQRGNLPIDLQPPFPYPTLD